MATATSAASATPLPASQQKPTCCAFAHGPAHSKVPLEEQILKTKIARARRSGPWQITKDATVAELEADGTLTILAKGTNHWTCTPGNENIVGNVPLCADPHGMRWGLDKLAGKPAPTNTQPGLIYMLCGATQHSNVDAFDDESPPIPIGPHWMITWPYDSARDGIPNNVRDAGAWVMFDKTPYAYLHICGTPWAGTAYHPEKACAPIWDMKYAEPYDENVEARGAWE